MYIRLILKKRKELNLALALFSLFVIQGSCSKFIVTECPPPTVGPVYIYKDCREAFKIYTTEWSFKLTESIEGLKKLAKVSAGQEFGNKAVKLAQEFDQINVAMQNEYVAACSLFNTGPCDPNVRERYYKEIEAIREQTTQLRMVYAKVQDLMKTPIPAKVEVKEEKARVEVREKEAKIDPRLETLKAIEDILTTIKSSSLVIERKGR
ncbi:MAG: hypothetical protein AABY79_05755 [Nitrospirota bacterium]